MSKPTTRPAQAPEASSYRQRAACARDAAGRFIRRSDAGQPQPASLPRESGAESVADAFQADAALPQDPGRGHPEESGRAGAAGGPAPRQEQDMGRHETFENAAPIAQELLAGTALSRFSGADPIFEAIERHVAARAACVGLDDGVDEEGYEDAHDARMEALKAVEATKPTTVAGLFALARHLDVMLEEDLGPDHFVEPTAEGHAFVALINACLELAEAPVPALPRPHPDQALLDAGKALREAQETLDKAEAEYEAAYAVVRPILKARPVALAPHKEEYLALTSPIHWKRWGNVRFRWVPPGEDQPDADQWSTVVWTGKGLRHAIARAVPAMGGGGRTPHLIRYWRSLLPLADAFDAKVEAIEAETDYERLRAARDAARKAKEEATAVIEASVATTPEGLAVLVPVIARYCWRDTGGGWPNLLLSAATVSGVDPASLEHQYASTRHMRA